jgi:hypothetical protein
MNELYKNCIAYQNLRIKEKFPIGTKVKVIKAGYAQRGNGIVQHHYSTQGSNEIIGVEHDLKYISERLHNLNGNISSNNGWYYYPHELEIINE